MKKYFITETDEELEFGDIIQIELEKVLEDGRATCEKEVEFNKDSVDYLLEIGIIEERDDELIDFEDECCETLSDLIEDFEELEERFDNLEDFTKGMYKELKRLVGILLEDEKAKTAKK